MHTDDFCMALMIAQHLQNNSSSAVSCWNPRAIWNANSPRIRFNVNKLWLSAAYHDVSVSLGSVLGSGQLELNVIQQQAFLTDISFQSIHTDTTIHQLTYSTNDNASSFRTSFSSVTKPSVNVWPLLLQRLWPYSSVEMCIWVFIYIS